MSGTQLPNAQTAFVADAKVRDYLLDPMHPGNGGKAGFYFSFGFTQARWPRLRDALRAHPLANSVAGIRPNPYGRIFTVRCNLVTPDGRDPCITSIWVVDYSGNRPRLVTAFP